MNKPTLVILGNGTQGLGIIRSAGISEIPIIQINDKYVSAARFSKYISKYVKLDANFLSKIVLDDKYSNELCELLLNLPLAYPSILMGTNEDINQFIL